MRYHFLFFVTTFFVSINAWEYSVFPLGCHKFFGSVKCANGNAIRGDAKVVLTERDDFSNDDYVAQSKVINGIFKVEGCDNTDPPTSELELYLEFYDVCGSGEYKLGGKLIENGFVHYTIYDSAKQAEVNN